MSNKITLDADTSARWDGNELHIHSVCVSGQSKARSQQALILDRAQCEALIEALRGWMDPDPRRAK